MQPTICNEIATFAVRLAVVPTHLLQRQWGAERRRKMATMVKTTTTITLLGIVLLLGFTAFAPKMRVTKLDPSRAYAKGYDVYYLPQTALDITVTLHQETYTPGPYSAFAESLLGIAGDAPQAGDHWRIDSVAVATSEEADYTAAFAVKRPKGSTFPEWLTLTKSGLLMAASTAPAFTPQGQSQRDGRANWPPFTDLSTAQFVADKSSIFYSVVQRDTTFVRVPVQRNVVVKESVEEKAKQAADLIFALRKKRVELICGDAELPTAPRMLQEMLDEISRVEAQYLSLFIGRWTSRRHAVRLRYTPSAKESSSMLCRFSTQSGICPTSELSATPLLIHVQRLEGPIGYPAEAKLPPLKNGLYYRPACMAEVTLTLLRDELLRARVPLTQLGPIVPIYSKPLK